MGSIMQDEILELATSLVIRVNFRFYSNYFRKLKASSFILVFSDSELWNWATVSRVDYHMPCF